ncbi:MAG TPA: hypothetical protein VIA18_03760 [Polyangia bacterium]|jgi:hypothetical protein|nr:hypothetical protein [Polyangia bacterium]HWE31651.1 hypothetical protein [Polyangia bacterium]
MTRLLLAFAFAAATSGAAFADESPTSGSAKSDAPPATPAPPKPPKAKNVTPRVFFDAKLSGENPHLPDDVKLRFEGASVAGMYKICVDLNGKVSEVLTVQSIPGGDGAVIDAIRVWKFKPQTEPICSMSRFQFNLR